MMRVSRNNSGIAYPLPLKKRLFDLAISVLAAPLWVPVLTMAALIMWLREGRPVFYVSQRRVAGGTTCGVIKFRTMIRNAERLVSRDTVPVNGTRFLNIPADSPLYTRTGRFVERLQFTELPQLLQVLSGRMSLVGNRPLPENVVRALREQYPDTEDRFLIPGGLTGPVQLVGRDLISDGDRLRLEAAYCHACLENYSCRLDLAVLTLTIMLVLGIRQPITASEAIEFVESYRFRPGVFVPIPGADEQALPREV